jgi:hypothetical protein
VWYYSLLLALPPLHGPSIYLPFLFSQKRENAAIFSSQNPLSPKGTYISLGRKPIAYMLAWVALCMVQWREHLIW